MTPFLWTKPQNALKSVLGALFLLLLSFGNARATHLAAADISVRYIGTQPGDKRCVPILTYEITLDIYKACEEGSIDLDQSAGINIATPSGCYTGAPGALNFTMTNPIVDTIDQLCADAKQLNACRMPNQGGDPVVTGSQPGFIRHRFVDTVSLPYACGDWVFSWTSGARNNGIRNLDNPGSQNIFVSCLINNVLSPKGSSPRFTITPTPFLCLNKPSSFLNGPEARDGGTVIIQPTAAKDAASPDTGSALLYVAPYTAANPVNSPSGYTVNPQTGSTEFVAPTQGKFVLAFRMYKYDSLGRMVSYVDRDVQIAVLPCVGNVPTVTDPPVSITGGTLVQSGRQGNVMTVCPGSTLRFNIGGTSASPTALLAMTDTLGSKIGNLSFIATKNPSGFTNNILGTFEYTPQPGEEGEYTKIFTISDTSCGISNQKIFQSSYVSVLIKVPGGIEAGQNGYFCPTDIASTGYQIQVKSPDVTSYTWQALPGGAGIGTLSCINCPNPIARPDSNTTYVVTAERTPYLCKNKDTITIEVNRIKTIPDEEMVICQPGQVQLQSVITGKTQFQDLRCGKEDSMLNCPSLQQATVGYCSDVTSQETPYNTANGSVRTQMIYQSQELTDGGLTNGSIRSISFFVDGTPSSVPIKDFKVSLACTPRRTYADGLGFESNTAQVFSAATLPPLVSGWNSIPLDKPYCWDPSQNLVVDICFNNGTPAAGATASAVQYSATGANSVLQSFSNTTNTCLVSPPATGSTNRPNIRFDFCAPQPIPFLPYWRPGNYFIDSNGLNASLFVPQTMKVYAEVVGYQGCVSRDSLTITVAKDTVRVTPKDSLICPGDVAILLASNTDYYRWFQDSLGALVPAWTLDCDSCPRVIVSPDKPTDYILVGYNYWGKDSTVCSDTLTVPIRFKTPNRVQVTPKEVTIKYGESIPLYAKNATVYTWSPATALNTNVGPSVMASPKATTTYVVTGLTEGCQSSDTTTVTVDRGTVVAMANAFTPNGDNVNDFFMPSTTPTQRVIEFRIFNRWGNQVFYSTSATPGWDGTYDGEPQQSDTYSYLIRITTPDGAAETIKGDVLLIR